MELVRTLVSDGAPAKQAADAIGRSVAMQESMPFAIFAFLSHPDSFEDCLFTAALNGGDRDTLAAMACAISGAYLGLEAIPEAWRARLENHDLIAALSRRLARMTL